MRCVALVDVRRLPLVVLHAFVDQHVRAVRVPDQVLAGAGVARQHDPAVLRFEQVAEGLVQRVVLHVEGGDPDPVDLGGEALVDLVDDDVRHSARRLADLHPHFEIGPVHFQQSVDHRPDARRPVDVPRRVAAVDPAADDEMPEVDIVVGVQVGDEQMVHLVRPHPRLDHPRDDARAAVDDEVVGARPDRVARAAPLGVGKRQPGSQQADLHALSPGRRCQDSNRTTGGDRAHARCVRKTNRATLSSEKSVSRGNRSSSSGSPSG